MSSRLGSNAKLDATRAEMRGGQRWTRSARATHEVRLLDYMNTSNMNKYTQRDGRGTTNFILVARAERLGEARSRTVKRAPRPTKGAGVSGEAAARDARTTLWGLARRGGGAELTGMAVRRIAE